MLRRAVALYHELLSEPALAEASRQMLDDGLERAKLIFGGRRLSPYLRPHFVTEEEFARAVRICETVWGAIQKVKDAAVAAPALQDELHLTAIEKELVNINPGYRAVSPTARLDSFLTDEAYSFVELNGESPAGIAYADSAAEIFHQLPVMARFTERYNVRTLEGRPLMLDVLLRAYEEYLGRRSERAPNIAIVDLKGLPTQKEFELFREYFEAAGYPACIAAPEDLTWDGQKLRAGDFAVDIVYKRLLVNEYLPIMDAQPALLEAYRAGAVCMVNSFQSKLIHKKALFVVLTDPRHAHLFNADEIAAIRTHVPWTRHVAEGRTDYKGREVDLFAHARASRDRLVLKPNDDYGGHGIYIGWNCTATEWDDALQTALNNGDYLLQERVPTAREVFPALTEDGAIQYAEQLVDLDPLLYFGQVGSAFTRLSFSELANVSSGGGMVPTFIISEKVN
jgi:uncharacterized circularly permuted ATP-grasp superfamily protein